jgi:hypothetical protein
VQIKYAPGEGFRHRVMRNAPWQKNPLPQDLFAAAGINQVDSG